MNRIKELIKSKGMSVQDVAEKLGTSRQSLHNKMKGNITIKTLEELSEAIGVNLHELLETQTGYQHFYDNETGEWLGIRKK